ncbi:MAG: peptidoglycan-associated lipoprotein Pal [Aquificaceae bacterium]|nr:MAG: peptidoglycan-associated lipoprotein Pal [Aquificaceae bacterium]
MKTNLFVFPLFLSILALTACSQQTVKKETASNNNTVPTHTTVSTSGGGSGSMNANGGALVRDASADDLTVHDTAGNSQINTIDADSLAAINELMGSKNYTPADLDDPSSILAQRIIYFDYDQASILDKYKPILAAHAELLANYPQVHVRLEGHADERGSREYNIALSERRAQTVRQYLSFKNVKSSQMETVAFGEEKPLVASHNSTAWNKNRRVEINYVTY